MYILVEQPKHVLRDGRKVSGSPRLAYVWTTCKTEEEENKHYNDGQMKWKERHCVVQVLLVHTPLPLPPPSPLADAESQVACKVKNATRARTNRGVFPLFFPLFPQTTLAGKLLLDSIHLCSQDGQAPTSRHCNGIGLE